MKIFHADLISGSISGSFTGLITSASYAVTASYAENGGGSSVDTGSLLSTASANNNIITFTKGDSSTFDITVDTGSGGGGDAFPFTGSATIQGDLAINNTGNGITVTNGGLNLINGALDVDNGINVNQGGVQIDQGDLTLTSGDAYMKGNEIYRNFEVTVGTDPSDGVNKYIIEGNYAPTLNFTNPGKYRFDLSNSTNTNHPLAFRLPDDSTYSIGVNSSGIAGNSGAYVEIQINQVSTASQLKYYCTVHGNAMGNTIQILDTFDLTASGSFSGSFVGDGSGLTGISGGGGTTGAVISSSLFDKEYQRFSKNIGDVLRYDNSNSSPGEVQWFDYNGSQISSGTSFSGNEGYDINDPTTYSNFAYVTIFGGQLQWGQSPDQFYHLYKDLGIEDYINGEHENEQIYLPEAKLIELETYQGGNYPSKVRFLCSSVVIENNSNGGSPKIYLGGTNTNTYLTGGNGQLNFLQPSDFITTVSSGTYTPQNQDENTSLLLKIGQNPKTTLIGVKPTAAILGIDSYLSSNINFNQSNNGTFPVLSLPMLGLNSGRGWLGEFKEQFSDGNVFNRIEFVDNNGTKQIFNSKFVVVNPSDDAGQSNHQIELISLVDINNLQSTSGQSWNTLNTPLQQNTSFVFGDPDQILGSLDISQDKYPGNYSQARRISQNKTDLSKTVLTGDIEGLGDATFTGDFKAKSLSGGALDSKDIGVTYSQFYDDFTSNFQIIKNDNSWTGEPVVIWYDANQTTSPMDAFYNNVGHDSDMGNGYFSYFELRGFGGAGIDPNENVTSFIRNFGITSSLSSLNNNTMKYTLNPPVKVTLETSKINSYSSYFKVSMDVSTIITENITNSSNAPSPAKIFFGGNDFIDTNPVSIGTENMARFNSDDFYYHEIVGGNQTNQKIKFTIHNGPTINIGCSHQTNKGNGASIGRSLWKDRVSSGNTNIVNDIQASSTNYANNLTSAVIEIQQNSYSGSALPLTPGMWFDTLTVRGDSGASQFYEYKMKDVKWYVEQDAQLGQPRFVTYDDSADSIEFYNKSNNSAFATWLQNGSFNFFNEIFEIEFSRKGYNTGDGNLDVSGDTLLQSNLYLPQIPESDPGVKGMIYRDGDFIKISTTNNPNP